MSYAVFFYRDEKPLETLQICKVRSFREVIELIKAIGENWRVGFVVRKKLV